MLLADFKARTLIGGYWVHGYLREIFSGDDPDGRYTICPARTFSEDGWTDFDEVAVNRDTICQWSGIVDCHGEKIYTSDLVRRSWDSMSYDGSLKHHEVTCVCVLEGCEFMLRSQQPLSRDAHRWFALDSDGATLTVVGNTND